MQYFSPEDIEKYEFLYSMPGYNRAEVRAFLKALAAQVRDLQKKLNEAESTETHSDIAGAVAAAEDATRQVLNAAEARMKTAAADLRAELDAFRLQMADLIAEVTTRVEEVAIASGPSAAVEPPPAVSGPSLATEETGPSESEDVVPPREASEEPVPPRVVPTGPIATSPGGEEQEIPPEWAELMREPEAEE